MWQHNPHPHTQAVLAGEVAPPKVDDDRVGINGTIGLFITRVVGTMYCAYVFCLIAFIGIPTALGSPKDFVAWVSSQFIQLVLLPIIIVGQNLQSKASDKRADATFKDAEAVLHECLELQKHLGEQDELLRTIVVPKRSTR